MEKLEVMASVPHVEPNSTLLSKTGNSEEQESLVTPKLEVLDCLTEPLTVLVAAQDSDPKDVVTQQLETEDGTQSLIVGTSSNTVSFNSSTTLTAVTLPDGTQAFVAQDIKLDPSESLETEALQLEDGSTLLIQEIPKLLDGHTIQLEDGTTAFLHPNLKAGDSYQPIELEDGSTAYIALNGSVLDSLNLETYTTLGGDSQDGIKVASVATGNASTGGDEEEGELSVRDRAKSFMCPHEGCGKLYTTLHHLKGCEKRFTEYSSLYKHHMVHSAQKPYYCTVCARHYRQASTLTMHKRTSHGIVEADDGTELVLGETVFALAASASSGTGSNKRLKTISSNFLGLKDGNTLVALQTSDSSNQLENVSQGQFLVVADPSHFASLEQFGVTTAQVEEQDLELVEDESSDSSAVPA
ncbi:hypothetical protein C0J52_19500 [Blattella germanica]|nr:hypothetical protein C0J52_19500 [Blattella germanica]